MGFPGGSLKKMMMVKEENERLKMEVGGYRFRVEELVVFLNQREEKGVWLMLEAAEDYCLSLPVES